MDNGRAPRNMQGRVYTVDRGGYLWQVTYITNRNQGVYRVNAVSYSFTVSNVSAPIMPVRTVYNLPVFEAGEYNRCDVFRGLNGLYYMAMADGTISTEPSHQSGESGGALAIPRGKRNNFIIFNQAGGETSYLSFEGAADTDMAIPLAAGATMTIGGSQVGCSAITASGTATVTVLEVFA